MKPVICDITDLIGDILYLVPKAKLSIKRLMFVIMAPYLKNYQMRSSRNEMHCGLVCYSQVQRLACLLSGYISHQK